MFPRNRTRDMTAAVYPLASIKIITVKEVSKLSITKENESYLNELLSKGYVMHDECDHDNFDDFMLLICGNTGFAFPVNMIDYISSQAEISLDSERVTIRNENMPVILLNDSLIPDGKTSELCIVCENREKEQVAFRGGKLEDASHLYFAKLPTWIGSPTEYHEGEQLPLKHGFFKIKGNLSESLNLYFIART